MAKKYKYKYMVRRRGTKRWTNLPFFATRHEANSKYPQKLFVTKIKKY